MSGPQRNRADEPPDNIAICCQEFRAAWRGGTDNEGYGTVLKDAAWRGGIVDVSVDLPPLKFCPWCSTPIRKRTPLIDHAALETLREPTSAMIDAGLEVLAISSSRRLITEIWCEMLNAAAPRFFGGRANG